MNPCVQTQFRRSRWLPLITATLTACMALNTPVLSADVLESAPADVLALQSLVAEVLKPPPPSPHRPTNALCTVLDVQRLLGDSSGAEQQQCPTDASRCWALAPPCHRGPFLELASTLPLRGIEIPRTSEEGLQQQVQPFPPPRLSRVLERYRMRLTPHAPPRISTFHPVSV